MNCSSYRRHLFVLSWLALAVFVSSECSSEGFCSNPHVPAKAPMTSLVSFSKAVSCPAAECDAEEGILEHHLDNNGPDGGSVACKLRNSPFTEQNAYLRCFDGNLCTSDRTVDSVVFRVRTFFDETPNTDETTVDVTVNLYIGPATGCNSLANVRITHDQAPVATEVVVVTEGLDFDVQVDFSDPVVFSPSESLLVEISVPSMVRDRAALFLADNDNEDQCDPSYLQTGDCGDTALVVDIANIDSPRYESVSHVITVNTSRSVVPSAAPSATPSYAPSSPPTPKPSPIPSDQPSARPTESPAPSDSPTKGPPSPEPSTPPSAEPTTAVPSDSPTEAPPSPEPSTPPSVEPTSVAPTIAPSSTPLPPVPPVGSPIPAPPPFCFAGGMMVQCRDRGWISMEDVRVGDWVATASQTFSRVYSLGHFAPDVETTFIQIVTNHPEAAPLEVTGDHYVFVNATGTVVRASEVLVGDVLPPSLHVVTDIRTVQRRGAYAPLTESGELLVSGVRVSSYVAVWKDNTAGGIVRSPHIWAQGLFSPVRLLCRWQPDYCAAETHSAVTGFSNLYGWLIEWLVWIGRWGPVVSGVLAILAVPVLVLLWGLEQALLSVGDSQTSTTLLIVGASFVWLCHRGQQEKPRRTSRQRLRDILRLSDK